MDELKQYLTSLFNGALKRGTDWIEHDFCKLLDIEYEKHGYKMLDVLKKVIINPEVEDWCFEDAIAFYIDIAGREHRDNW